MTENAPPRILMVDDEPDLLESCARILEDEGIECLTTTDPLQVMGMIRESAPEVLVTDFKMPGMSGVELMEAVREEYPEIPIIMVSAYATVEGVVRAVKMGAFDYITKPFTPDQLVITVKRAVERRRLARENSKLRQRVREDFLMYNFVGRSKAMLTIAGMVKKVGPTRTCVLIQGEGGAGKETAARAFHMNSGRDSGPFVAVDCAEVTKEMLMASSLDAGQDSQGQRPRTLFERARGGVLYLKSAEMLDKSAQEELSRVLQQGAASMPGTWERTPVDTRVISSSSAGLKELVNEGKFRQDLYYLLNVVNVLIPPLRERLEDIPLLCEHFLSQIAKRDGSPARAAGREFVDKLCLYHWPGNVRELKGVLETAAAGPGEAELKASDLPENIRKFAFARGMAYKDAKEEWMGKFEKDFLENLLYTSKGNITQAAEMAGVARMSLYRMIRRNNLAGLAVQEREAGNIKNGAQPDDPGQGVSGENEVNEEKT